MARKRFLTASAVLIVAGALLPTMAVMAQSSQDGKIKESSIPQKDYNVSAGPLANVLVSLAQVSGATIVFDPQLVANKVSNGVRGTFTREGALHEALKGTDLTPLMKSDGTLSVQSADTLPGPTSVPLAANQTNFKRETQKFPTVNVIGKYVKGYTAYSTSSATRTDTPLDQIPQAVDVVSNDIMKSQQVKSVSDVLKNVAGVSLDGSGSPYIRGFQAAVSKNGLVDNLGLMTATGGISTPVIGVQQVTVIKGPDSILAGSMDPGGVVDVTMKAPQATPYHELELQASAYGDRQIGFDTTGPIFADDKRLTYRFIASDEQSDKTFGGYNGLRNLYLNAQLAWKSKGTNIVIGVTRESQITPIAPYTILLNGKPATPRSSPISSTADSNSLNADGVDYDVTKDLGASWKFHGTGSVGTGTQNVSQYALSSEGLAPLWKYQPSTRQHKVNGINIDQNVKTTFSIGSITNTLLGGLSYKQSHLQYLDGTGQDIQASIYEPNLPPVNHNPLAFYYMNHGKESSEQLYLQDQVAWGDFHALVSLAHSRGWDSTYDQAKWLPNIGIVYKLTDHISVYANEMHSFATQPDTQLVGGGVAPPSIGKQSEVGFKINMLNEHLSATVSAFRSAISNVATYIPSAGASILSPGNVSKGIEVSVQGQLAPGWQIIGNYTNSRFTVVTAGYSQLPRNRSSLWTTYDFQKGCLQGWGVGAGAVGRSGYAITDDKGVTYRMPGQMSANVSVYYKRKRWSFTLGVKNIFNKLMYADSAAFQSVAFDPGRTSTFTATYEF